MLEILLAAMAEHDASDLFLHEGVVPRIRQHGRVLTLGEEPVPLETLIELAAACNAPDSSLDFDGSLDRGGNGRFRVSLFRQLGHRGAVLRRIKSNLPDLDALGLPSGLLSGWLTQRSGFVIVSGRTGSGKSTSLAAGLAWLNNNHTRHVVTIEDPVEFLLASGQCLFSQREVGIDTISFAEGLRRALRQSPDVILVGETRDSASALTAVQAAETGHLVLTTLHGNNVSETLGRLVQLFPAESRETALSILSGQLIGVLCQRLVPTVDGGLVLAVETFENQGVSRKYLREGQVPEIVSLISRPGIAGNRSFNISLQELIQAGRISEEEGLRQSDNPGELQRLMRGISAGSPSR